MVATCILPLKNPELLVMQMNLCILGETYLKKYTTRSGHTHTYIHPFHIF